MDGQAGEENYELLSIDDRLTHKVRHPSLSSPYHSLAPHACNAVLATRFEVELRLLFFVSTTSIEAGGLQSIRECRETRRDQY